MTNSDAIREFAEVITQQILTYLRAEACFIGEFENEIRKKIEEQLTALISEHYVAKEEVDKMVSERLREELMAYDKFLSNTYWGVSHLVKRDEAVDEYLKSRER